MKSVITFVSVDGDSGSSSDSTPSTSDTSSDSSTSYSAGALAKSLTIDKIQAGKSVNLKLTMTARKDIKRALNLKNSVNVTASVIETANDNSGNANGGDGGNANDGTTEGKDDTSTEKKNDTTEEKSDSTTENTSNATDTAKGALAQATSAEDNTTKGGNSNAGNTANNTSKIVALPVDEAMHNDTEIISIGKYAVHYSNVSEKEYRTNMGYKTGKEYAKHIETLAKFQLKERLAVAAIAKANNLEVTEDYNQKEQEKLAQEFGFSTVEELNAKMVRNEIRLMIKKFYVADYLIKHSK